MTKIVLNGKEVEVDPKQPLIAACHEHVDVPMYCYHPGLTPVGSCRICQVSVQIGEMPPRVVVACRTPITEGMVVDTEAAPAHEARKQCLEFLLKNHPLDCPICDKAGECDLQDYSFAEGQGEGRSVEPRRKLEKRKSLGDVILLDQERCILCSRCVRFFEDVTEKPQLTVAGLGSRSVISTFMDRPLEGNYQGNVADICPVGALTLKDFRFQARVWNLQKRPSTCGECSRGCSITAEVLRKKEIKRVRPLYDSKVNRWWMCDHGRFAFKDRAERPRLAGGAVGSPDGARPVTTAEALSAVGDVIEVYGKPRFLLSPWLTNEEAESAFQMARRVGIRAHFVSPPPSDLKDDLLHTGDPCPNRRGLEDLGFTPVTPEAAIDEINKTGSTVLIGERICDLIGREALVGLHRSVRVVVFDTHVLEAPAARVCVGIPDSFEKDGTWHNVDGIERRLTAAVPPPADVLSLPRLLESLGKRIGPAQVH